MLVLNLRNLSLHVRRSLWVPAVFAALLVVATGSPTRAQIGGIDSDPGDRGSGGRNVIQGSIFYPNGRRLDRRAKVKLRGMTSGEQFRLSDDSGSFTFRNLQGGTYTIIIDAGPEFEVITETVDIIEPIRRLGAPGIVVPVTYYLQPKHSATGKVGTVDVATAGVPEDARDRYQQALEASKEGDAKKAIEHLNAALKIYPNYMAALNELGVQYLRLKQLDKAADALRAAIKLAPEAFTPHLNYGIVLLQMKDSKGAVAELRMAVQKDSSSASAHFYLGRAYINMNDFKSAEKELQQAIDIDASSMIEAHRYLGAVYIERHNNERAVQELEKYLKLAPKAKDAEQIRAIIKDLRAQAKK